MDATWLPFAVTFRVGRKVRTWIRFAPDAAWAVASATGALREEFYGAAMLIKVECASS